MMGGWNKGKSANLQWLRDHVSHVGDACLIWPFGKRWNGYGQVGDGNGKVAYPHRIMCEMVHGAPPTAKHVAAHSCHNGHNGCVHPKHLDWKTARQNVLERKNVPDMDWPTRQTSIPAEHIAKIIELRGKMNQREIGKMFGISYQHVSVIQRGLLVTQ
jgi:hypothetical protein